MNTAVYESLIARYATSQRIVNALNGVEPPDSAVVLPTEDPRVVSMETQEEITNTRLVIGDDNATRDPESKQLRDVNVTFIAMSRVHRLASRILDACEDEAHDDVKLFISIDPSVGSVEFMEWQGGDEPAVLNAKTNLWEQEGSLRVVYFLNIDDRA